MKKRFIAFKIALTAALILLTAAAVSLAAFAAPPAPQAASASAAFATAASGAAATAAASVIESPNVRIVIDGIVGNYTDAPIEINNRILLPFRELLTKLGVPNDDEHIIWNEAEESVTVRDGDTEIRLAIGNNVMSVNGVEKQFDIAPFFYEKIDRTYIPVRAVSELLDKLVTWEESSTTVYVRGKENYAETVELLERISDADEHLKMQASAETELRIKISAKKTKLPNADETGAVNITSTISQIIRADAEANVKYIKQVGSIMGDNIGSEMFVIGDRAFAKVEGPDSQWIDGGGLQMDSFSAINNQVGAIGSQMSARSPEESAMRLGIAKNPDGTYSIVGEPINIADINSIFDEVNKAAVFGNNASINAMVSKLQISETLDSNLRLQKSVIAMGYSMTMPDMDIGGGKRDTVYFDIDSYMVVNYDDVPADYSIEIPAEIQKML